MRNQISCRNQGYLELNMFSNFLINITIIYISHWPAYQTHYDNDSISHILPNVKSILVKIIQKAPIQQFLEPLILRYAVSTVSPRILPATQLYRPVSSTSTPYIVKEYGLPGSVPLRSKFMVPSRM